MDSERRRQADMTIKRESMEEPMSTSSEYPVDMSVMSRDNGSESLHPRFAPVSLARDLNSRAFFQAAFYGQGIIGHSPETFNQQQHFQNHMHSLQPEPQLKQLVSPTSQRKQVQSHHTSSQQVRSTHHTITPPRSASETSSPNHLKNTMTGFKLKGNDGKLVLPEDLASNSSGYSSIDLVPLNTHQRAKREFVPEDRKDNLYWNKRLKNNDSARRSRVKRKSLERLMEQRLMELQKENIELRHEMAAIKRRFGLTDETAKLSTQTIGAGSATTMHREAMSGEFSSSSSSSPLSREFSSSAISKDEELEQQSAGSDDSPCHDDSRSCNLGSMAALSLVFAGRDRSDSFGSGTSSGGRSSRPESRSSQSGPVEARTDKLGALDLTSDHSNRSTPARDSISPEGNGKKNGNNSPICENEFVKRNGQEMRGFPLKCRWKREMQSVTSSSSKPTSNRD